MKPFGFTIFSGRALIRLALFLSLLIPVVVGAAEPEGTAPPHGTAADFTARLEKLQATYQLFPLDKKLKRQLATDYADYGGVLLKKRQYDQADEYFVKALELYPDDSSFSLMRGICTYNLKKYDVARYELEQVRILKPDSVEALYYLGLVLYETDTRQQAMELWEQALKLAPGHTEITRLLEKSRKEMAVEESMDRGHSSRFNLTYDPGVSATTAQAILDVLESAAIQVGSELGHFPEARVPVSIYKRDDYKAVTASPDWSGGVYDGTIRLPFGTATEITAPLRAILFHEYAHVVVYDLTHGNCPVWLNEGIAEIFGRRQFSHPQVAQPVTGTSAVDVRRLEGSFRELTAQEASRAYQQSHSLVSYLVNAYGWHRVTAILTALGAGKNINIAVASALHDYSLSYDGLVKEWRESLGK